MNTDTAISTESRIRGIVADFLGRAWKLLCNMKVQRRKHALQLCETLPLGEKRLLAIVQCDGQRLLIGATGDSISLLLRLSGGGKEKLESRPTKGTLSTGGLVQ